MVNLPSNRYPNARRRNLPTDRTERFMEEEDTADHPFRPEAYASSYPTLQWHRGEPQEFWHGPLYIHEKIHPAVLIQSALKDSPGRQTDMFAQFNGLPENAAYEWYDHQGYWQNRMIHGDARRVMASLTNREGLTGQVHMIYIDPPYNIKFSANFQLRADETETAEGGNAMPHDPLAVKAFRDQYQGKINTYLDNLHQQLLLARELLTESGSCFVQIGPDNLHQVACVMAEVFGYENHVATIPYTAGTNQSTRMLPEIGNWILWFAKNKPEAKYYQLYQPLNRKEKVEHMSSYAMCELPDRTSRNLTKEERSNPDLLPAGTRLFRRMRLDSANTSETGRSEPFEWNGQTYHCHPNSHWRVSHEGLRSIALKNRLVISSNDSIAFKRYEEEVPGRPINAVWSNLGASQDKRYIVQTPETAIERCILMTTDPGDLIIDPTCGSGTTAYIAEKWGRRWITIDTSRVAIAVARQRLTTSRYDYHILQDSATGAKREAELSGKELITPTGAKDVALGFIYPRIPRVSAATLAYDIEDYIYLVDQPEKESGKLRVCSPFTVESDSQAATVGTDHDIQTTEANSRTREQILEALPITGINYRKGHWQINDLEPYPDSPTISHTATLTENSTGEQRKAAIYIAPADSTVSTIHIRHAAEEAAQIVPQINTLLTIAFAYEAPATDREHARMGRIQIIRAETNKDLTIPGLANTPSDSAFVIIADPDVNLRKLSNGQLELEVRGIDTYDPKQRTVIPGEAKDIYCILTDTDFDGLAFKARRINFPNQTKDKQLERLKRDLARHVDNERWEQLFTTTTIPFDPPIEGKVAVKVIDRAAMETMRILEIT